MPSDVGASRVPQDGRAFALLQILDLPLRRHGHAAGEIEVGEGGWTGEVLERFADRVLEIAGRHDHSQSYLLRPLPSTPSHATPVSGLYMLGAATWPGHGINGGWGRIVAQMLLE